MRIKETNQKKTECIVFTAGLCVVCWLLVYFGGIRDVVKTAAVVLPLFVTALTVFSCNRFSAGLCAMVLPWIPQIVILKTANYTALLIPVLSLLFASSRIPSARSDKKTAAASLAIAACAAVGCAVYNLSQFLFVKRYFDGRWDKLDALLLLFGALFIYLYTVKIKTGKHTKTAEKTVVKYARILFVIATADIAIAIETLFQLTWYSFQTHNICCMAWILFLAGLIRYETPQVVRILEKLKITQSSSGLKSCL